MRILRAIERSARPWKNGGGLTYEVIAHPPGSGLTQFDWRVSLAQVREAGWFSLFPGIERRMAVLEGELSLSVSGRETETEVAVLSPLSPPLVFAGETPVFAEPRGAVTDLNVMVRRGLFEGGLERHHLGAPLHLAASHATRVLIALADLTAHGAAGDLALSRLDALAIDPGEPCELSGRGAAAALFVAQIRRSAG
jgi:environmental stress-induced protein Ves